jgi:hypothetical protein
VSQSFEQTDKTGFEQFVAAIAICDYELQKVSAPIMQRVLTA